MWPDLEISYFSLEYGKENNGKGNNRKIKSTEDHELKDRKVWKEMMVGVKELLEGKDEWFE